MSIKIAENLNVNKKSTHSNAAVTLEKCFSTNPFPLLEICRNPMQVKQKQTETFVQVE